MKIGLIGYGKMGKMIETKALACGHSISCIIDPFVPGEGVLSAIPQTVPEAGNPDLFVEFTRPESAPENIIAALALGKPLVSGTTGWYKKLPEVSAAAEKSGTALLWSSNFSLGVNLFYRIASYAAALADPFAEYDVGGLEVHHRKKLDSPSGTAKTLMEKVLAAMKRKTNVLWDVPDGKTPGEDTVHFASLRHGMVPGTHSIFFDSPADTIEITHTARSREGFASGVIIAAEWLVSKNTRHTGDIHHGGDIRRGIFTMDDVLKDMLP